MYLFSWRNYLPLVLAVVLFSFAGCKERGPKKILVIAADSEESFQALNSLNEIAREKDFLLDTLKETESFSEDSLSQYSSIAFVGLYPDTLNFAQRIELQRFFEGGGGVMVVNSVKDTIVNWPWLNTINNEIITSKNNPHQYENGAGRFYFVANTGNAESYQKGLIDGIAYLSKSSPPDYTKATTLRVPESNRFVVEVLDTYMYEPMEMVIFKDGRILYVERRGDIKIYDPKIRKSKVIAQFDVHITGNYEDGILGVTLDPDFEKNHWIYINYSPAGNVSKQNVSRFEMHGDSIYRSTEKIVLEIPTQRETCCHSGGHLEFGPGGNLYISTGDNTSSKESDGFSPIDERPGRGPFDAQKSSGNTHDLRGKILRIHPEPDGTYTIPDGNLFPKDGSQGKPEIYVMGTRNAFRFSVDPKTGYVYWGDVGPDGGVNTERGPESFDEFNQARKPGNYGWPYFVADNKAYADFDFATNKIGPKFNPEKPENLSPNNTGSRFLPPAQKPMIWYPYGDSREFPELGKGSRSAMAGPMYYYDDFKNAKTRFPKYYDGKLFIYEWARSWVKVVSFDKEWNLNTIEPFIPGQEWYKPIDMKFGADGSLYVLQYGANYFEHNPDSRLVKITYVEGNRAPVAKLTGDKLVGATPLVVKLSAAASFDADKNEKLTYKWEFPGSDKSEINGSEATVTYNKPGVFIPVVTVIDKDGKTAEARVQVRAGNDMPTVEIITAGNRSFYFDNKPLSYKINVEDREDGALGKGIEGKDVFVSFDYLKEGKDLALLESNAQLAGGIRNLKGRNLLENSDCKTCHTLKDNSIGPSYVAIADRYQNKDVVAQLADKILKGGNGNWGKNMMAAHPQHTRDEAIEMVRYILSVNQEMKSLANEGTLRFEEHKKDKPNGTYVMRASYTDKSNRGAGSLTNSGMLILRNPKVEAEDMQLERGMNMQHVDGASISFINGINDNSAVVLPKVDLTGIGSVQISATSRNGGTRAELRLGSKNGNVVGEFTIGPNASKVQAVFQTLTTELKPVSEIQDLYIVFRNEGEKEDVAAVDWIRFVPAN